ncbi:hypothetical protein HanIR_Chr04g0200891 [Helianthus annuus]|nr:hypothetical protein HanIR_Chr04g0200891 [Helianthus annuus]
MSGYQYLAAPVGRERKRRQQQRNMKMFHFLRLFNLKHNGDKWEEAIRVVFACVETDTVYTGAQIIDYFHQLTASSVFIRS